MKIRLLFSLLFLIAAATANGPVVADDDEDYGNENLVVTRYFSGLWEQTKHESQGIVLQIVDQEDEDGDPRAVAYWFTYGDDLGTAWYMAIGEVEGNQVLMDLYTAYGVEFLQDEEVEVNPVAAVGTLNLAFKNCNKGTATYDMGDGPDEFEISRLAGLYNGRCSGGISDNTPGDAKPLKLEVDLYPPTDGMDGEGEAKFFERSDRTDFIVEVEHLPDGLYDVQYCDTLYEEVLTVDNGEGEVHFRSPEAEGKPLLIDDPRDCRIDVLMAGEASLTSGDRVLGDDDEGGAKDDDDDSDQGDEVEVKVDLDNTGVIEGAKGEVEYEVEGDKASFEVEIEHVPAGSYSFWVDGVQYGELVVAEGDDEAELKFSDPKRDDTELLEFVPWEMIIEIENEAGEVVLETIFPSAP